MNLNMKLSKVTNWQKSKLAAAYRENNHEDKQGHVHLMASSGGNE